ncbi:tyrosine-protein phosphatase [Streptomyces radicis]|uniref:Tyrosine-protein phosphatase n=1 Tax=Streptomyces radicis TaxID=1750517 RepID=A0A3A9WBU9_9ACTN|nr:tyrosine-protein phosphatase [Streptomyces radicis]RKN10568.1 tyrosine-protein phosphatase [Streptomyces radicis]RKN24828.1 tyrosine-protein phosphatase [Streptomyces radicis]
MTERWTEEPSLTGVRNFRDMGGLPTADGRRVRRGLLFRSGHLAHATAEDRAFLEGLGLRTVFDFRNAADQAIEGPDVAVAGARNISLPLTEPDDGAAFWALVREGSVVELRAELTDGRGEARMVAMYRTMILARTAEHGRVLKILSREGLPALLHCSAGKDRAGLTIAVVLLALGVSREVILADYLESNAPHRRYPVRRGPGAEGWEAGVAEEITRLLAPMFDARAEYLTAAFDHIDEDWGGTEAYLSDALGLTPEDRERLDDRLVEDA